MVPVWAQHTIEGTLYFQAARADGMSVECASEGFAVCSAPRSGGENCVSVGRRTRGRAP